jgi:hypothetical protein
MAVQFNAYLAIGARTGNGNRQLCKRSVAVNRQNERTRSA